MIIRLKHFCDSLNIVVIFLARARQVISAKCVQIPFSIYGMKLSKEDLSSGTVIIHHMEKHIGHVRF